MIPLINIESKFNSGRLAVDDTTDSLVIWGKENTFLGGSAIDIENNKQIMLFRDEFNDPTCNYIPYFMSKDKLFVLSSDKGSFDLYDFINGQLIENIKLPSINCIASLYFIYLICFLCINCFVIADDNNEKWFSNTMYTNCKETTTYNVMLISSLGTLVTYDTRNCKTPQIYQKEMFSKCNNKIHINYNPIDLHKTAISGFDGNVYIMEDCNRNVVQTFKHEGHLFTEDGDVCKSKVTTSTLWLPMCGSNTLLSAASDGSIQGWQYIS